MKQNNMQKIPLVFVCVWQSEVGLWWMCADAEGQWRWSDVSVWLTAVECVCACACECARGGCAVWHYVFYRESALYAQWLQTIHQTAVLSKEDSCVTHSPDWPSHTFTKGSGQAMASLWAVSACSQRSINAFACACLCISVSERICMVKQVVFLRFCFEAAHNYAYEVVSWVALRRWASVKQSLHMWNTMKYWDQL